ncbi:MAG: hypothetical protein P4L51_01000 [Puia sp.]|nr:hypothetical protein [Puia sp.]
MRIAHRIGINPDSNQQNILTKAGISLPVMNSTVSNFFSFILYEDSKEYIKLKPYFEKWQVMDMIGTEFADEEVESAEILVANAQWLNGCPQPEEKFSYIGLTYSDEGSCKACGIRGAQKAPFRLKKEPNWGNKKIFHLNWVFDEFFVRRDVYETFFKKYGIEVMPVLLHKKDTVIESTVQLIVPEVEVPLVLDNFDYEVCGVCGVKKYAPYFRGFFPGFKGAISNLFMWKSKERFGTGANAFKRTFLTKEVRRELINNKMKMDFIPTKQG